MEPIFQHPSDLVLALYNAPPPPLTVLKSRRVRIGQWEAAFHIIGESHAVMLSKGGRVVRSEVLACTGTPAGAVYTHAFSAMAWHRVRLPGHGVAVSFDVLPWDVPPPGRDQITLQFPKMFGQTPLTRVQWQVEAGALRWYTVHVYPLPDGAVRVYSRSQFALDA